MFALGNLVYGSLREPISRLAVKRSAESGRDWYNSNHTTRHVQLLYAYRFLCDRHYYGPSCAVLCRDRDDRFGHNYCTDNGTMVCLHGWTGDYCDQAICLSGCHADHGFCDNPHECRCREGWEGRFCNVCKPHPQCVHGTCSDKPYECNCQQGWGGLLCNQNLNYCTYHSPCQKGGTCMNAGEGSYVCRCKPGYSGVNCEDTIDHCLDRPCLNGATCQSSEAGFTCSCAAGYYGAVCGQEADHCRPHTCHNGGTCLDHQGSYQCLCPQGYGGFHCQTETGGCKHDSCKNGGKCVGGQCICTQGFKGPTCEDDGHDYCALQPCHNSGVCQELSGDFQCRCVAGWVGPTCRVNVDDCEMRPCANGGSCTDLVNDFRCQCVAGWVGKDCSVNEDNCLSRPCQHGATCRDRIDDYECQCPEGFWGKDCQLYHGMTTATAPVANVTHPPLSGITEEGDHRSSNRELLLGVCLGVGIPILVLILCAVVLLCRKLRRRPEESMDKERQQNYFNNLHALRKASNTETAKRFTDSEGDDGVGSGLEVVADSKLDDGGGDRASPIFTTCGLHSSAAVAPAAGSGSGPGGAKVTNEDQEDVNRLSCLQHQGSRGKTPTKHFLRDRLAARESAPHTLAPSLPSLPSHRDCRVHDVDKPVRRLQVDPVSGDTQVDISTYRRHSGDISILGKSNLAPLSAKDCVRRSLYLQPVHTPPPHTEGYLATEV
ncbi:hypothetical protein ACOMHN_025971 [Nucella lapillus]